MELFLRKPLNPTRFQYSGKCKEVNSTENQVCTKCGYPLTIEAYEQIKQKEQDAEKEMVDMKQELHRLYNILYQQGIIKGEQKMEQNCGRDQQFLSGLYKYYAILIVYADSPIYKSDI